jgi:polyisoprenoid-binding protein YceI
MTNSTAAGTTGLVPAGDWIAHTPACTVTFAVRNFGLHTVTGQIPLTSAAVIADPSGQPIRARAELDARGIDTGNRRRDSDLRGPRFLAADRWPAIAFEASDVQASGTGSTVDGTLTVKDRRCPARLDVSSPGMRPGDPAALVALRATGRLDRRVAGMDAAPALLVGHMISLPLAARLCPPAAIPEVWLRRAPGTTTPAKEGQT